MRNALPEEGKQGTLKVVAQVGEEETELSLLTLREFRSAARQGASGAQGSQPAQVAEEFRVNVAVCGDSPRVVDVLILQVDAAGVNQLAKSSPLSGSGVGQRNSRVGGGPALNREGRQGLVPYSKVYAQAASAERGRAQITAEHNVEGPFPRFPNRVPFLHEGFQGWDAGGVMDVAPEGTRNIVMQRAPGAGVTPEQVVHRVIQGGRASDRPAAAGHSPDDTTLGRVDTEPEAEAEAERGGPKVRQAKRRVVGKPARGDGQGGVPKAQQAGRRGRV